jgi:hypothetical protein
MLQLTCLRMLTSDQRVWNITKNLKYPDKNIAVLELPDQGQVSGEQLAVGRPWTLYTNVCSL